MTAETVTTDHDALARAAGCSRRTLERWRRAGAPMPGAGETVDGWVVRLREWAAKRPKRKAGPVFVDDKAAAAKKATVDWEEQSRRALALTRLHDLKVKQGEFLPRDRVVSEWARRCFAVRTKLLALPRAIAGAVIVPPEVRAQIEAESSRIVREALLEFVRASESTPTPSELQQLEGNA
jgi:hypothetical protein